MTARLARHIVLAGAAWGLLASLFAARAFGSSLWSGVLATPLIALLVARLNQSRFESAAGLARGLIALVSLFLGAALFGTCIGIHEVFAALGTHRRLLETLLTPLLAVLWGITFTGFLLFLWPLAYFTHFLLEWSEDR